VVGVKHECDMTPFQNSRSLRRISRGIWLESARVGQSWELLLVTVAGGKECRSQAKCGLHEGPKQSESPWRLSPPTVGAWPKKHLGHGAGGIAKVGAASGADGWGRDEQPSADLRKRPLVLG